MHLLGCKFLFLIAFLFKSKSLLLTETISNFNIKIKFLKISMNFYDMFLSYDD